MNPDIANVLHNRVFQVGAAGAAAVGLYVLVRRRGGGAAGNADGGGSVGAGGIGNPAYLNTTGTDVASWLGNYSASLQAQLDAFGAQLRQSGDGLGQLPSEAPSMAPSTIAPRRLQLPLVVVPAPLAPSWRRTYW